MDAKMTIYFALMIASHRGKKEIGVDDLLVALTWRQHQPDCPFQKLKDDFALIWEGVQVPHFPITARTYELRKGLGLDRKAKKVVARTAVEADLAREYWIDIDHQLRAILFQEGQPAKALHDAGWDRERVVAAGAAGKILYPPKALPWRGHLYRMFLRLGPFRWIIRLLPWLLIAGALYYLHSQNGI